VFTFISSLFVRVSQDFPTSRLPFLIITHVLSNFFPITTSFLPVNFTELSSHFTNHCRRSELTLLVSFSIFSYSTFVHAFFPYSFIKFGLLVNFKHEFLCEKVCVIRHMLCCSELQFRFFFTLSLAINFLATVALFLRLVCILYVITHNKAFLFIRHNRNPPSHFEIFHDLPVLQTQYSVYDFFVTRNHHHVLWQPLVSERILDLQPYRKSHKTTIF
jgi:hypothetical protein